MNFEYPALFKNTIIYFYLKKKFNAKIYLKIYN